MKLCVAAALIAATCWWGAGDVEGSGFDGIPGDYCKVRTPEQCCHSRNDQCTMKILGNHLCYCDMFCDRGDRGDCCPDFQPVCRGVTAQPVIRDDCIYDKVGYREGDQVMQNCNSCQCVGGRWSCENNVCMIQGDLLNAVNNGRYSWRGQNYTRFWGKTLDFGIKFRLGTLFPERSVSNMNEILVKNQATPESFDARNEWPNYISPVRDQENCGSSWAFSTTAISADRLRIMSDGKLDAILSPQQLISCNQHRQKGCEGGYLDRAWWYIRKLGVVSTECYPYNSGRTNDPGTCQIPKSQYRRPEGLTCPSPSQNAKIFKMTPPYRLSSKEEDIKTEIMINGPVQATFKVHEDFYMYAGGVYRYSDAARNKPDQFKAEGYHSVRILGWGVDRSNGSPVKYWLCANSWGQQWGEQGLFRILRGENHCDIETFVIGAWGKGSKRRRRKFKIRKIKRKRLRKLRL